MDLHIKDRLLIPSIFPERGNFMDFNLKKSIARKIAISGQDISYFITHNHIFHTNGNLSYCTDSHLLF